MDKCFLKPEDAVEIALKERGLSFKLEEIESAFRSQADILENWVSEHLNLDALLSKDELIQYTKLESSGSLKKLLQDPSVERTRPVLETDIKSAIDSLRASTAATRIQTGILQAQCHSIDKLSSHETDRLGRQERNLAHLSKKHEFMRQQVNVATRDLRHKLDVVVKNDSEQITADGKRVLSHITAKIKEHDKTLSRLERIVSGLDSMNDDTSAITQIKNLTAKLASYTAEEIQCRLDRLYLETTLLMMHGEGIPSADGAVENIAALKTELDTLYPEIGVLAEMSSWQQFCEPALRELGERRGKFRDMNHKNLEHVLDTIVEMTTDVQQLTGLLRTRQSFCETFRSLVKLYQEEAGPEYPEGSSRRESKRYSLLGCAESSKPSWPESPALDSFLRRIGISPEAIFQSQMVTGNTSVLFEKKMHLLQLLRGIATAVNSSLETDFFLTDSVSQQLASSLLAESHFGISLSDVQQQSRLEALEARVKRFQQAIESLHVDVVYGRDRYREKFLGQWS